MGFSNPISLSIDLPDGQIASKSYVDTVTASVREGPLNLKDSRVGAVLDGSNETAKLAAAVAMLSPSAGGHIFIPPGTLGLASEITLPDYVTLTGANHGTSTIQPASGYSGRLISTGGSNRIGSLRFEGLGVSDVLLTVRKARSMFHNLHFSNSGTQAIEFVGTGSSSSAHANKITDINIEDCTGTGIFVNAWAYDNEFLNTWIGECQVGLRMQDGACFFNNLHVWGSRGNGIELRPGAHKNKFQNVYIETNGTSGVGNGVDAFNVNGNQFIGGRLWKNANAGAMVGGSDRTRLMGLDIHANGAEGVRGSDSLLCQVVGNQFYDEHNVSPVRQTRPINTVGTSNLWIITNNIMRASDHVTGGKVLVGAGNVVVNNIE